jgi:hypothetical protein
VAVSDNVSNIDLKSTRPTPVQAVDRPLRVYASGIGEAQLKPLRFFFDSICDGACRIVENPWRADLFLIDVDSDEGRRFRLDAKRRHGSHPAILLSAGALPGERAPVLRKPLRAQRLQEALARFAPSSAQSPLQREAGGANQLGVPHLPKLGSLRSPANVSTRTGARPLTKRRDRPGFGGAADIDPADPEQLRAAQYDPDDYMQGRVAAAQELSIREQCPVRLGEPRFGIVVWAEQGIALLEGDHKRLRNVASIPLLDKDFRPRPGDPDRLPRSLETGRHLSLQSLTWEVTLRASRGRIPRGSDPLAPIRLRRWPDLPRLLVFPHMVRIAAFWLQRPVSPIEVARLLSVPQRSVFSFYSAASALELIRSDTSGTVPEGSSAGSATRHRNHGLLGRLFQRLQLDRLAAVD